MQRISSHSYKHGKGDVKTMMILMTMMMNCCNPRCVSCHVDKLSVCSYDSYHLSSNEFNNTKAHRGDRRFSKLEGLHIAEEVTCVGLLQITTPIITYWVRHTDWSLWQATCGSLDITGNNCAIFLVMEIPVIYLNCLHGSSGCGKNGNTTTRKFQNKYHPALHQSTVIVSSIMVFWKQ
ncbi:uncharacterized protein LOC106876874 isoform X2 [Octopus bimaculoides]|uniref:uncharacterized protein LOC106876874 isoform X2 n=1 Tax=Octopus bimaculoides TaxID=37653 RepID=UPI0022E22CAF|nr:uncharacterized protein LOC106876874 isoform X2 [Octopus bimaculoides]